MTSYLDNWEEFSPEVLPLDSVPIKSPYPCPTWTPAPPSLTSFVISTPPPPAQPTQYLLQSSDASRVKKEEERNPEVLISVKTEPDAETKVKVEVSSGEYKIHRRQHRFLKRCKSSLFHRKSINHHQDYWRHLKHWEKSRKHRDHRPNTRTQVRMPSLVSILSIRSTACSNYDKRASRGRQQRFVYPTASCLHVL